MANTKTNRANGRKSPTVTISAATFKKQKAQIQEMENTIRNAELISRSLLSARLGIQFDGDRDLYSSFGYPLQPTFMEYKAHFDRQGIATRIIEKFADDTWGNPPAIIDGEGSSLIDDSKQTPFIKEFLSLAKRLNIWAIFRQADIMCGVGRYSVIFMGAPGKNFLEPAGNGALSYMATYDEKQALISKWETDPNDPKFAMPLIYSIIFNSYNDGAPLPSGGSAVHNTRVLHVSENRYGSRVYGRPRMQPILNRLYDLEKVTGGAAEAVWLTITKGLVLTGQKDTQLPDPNSEEGKYLEAQLQMWAHRLQRYLILENVDVKDMGVDEIKAKETFDILIEDLCASVGMPRRILVGSERGELASSQDQREWNGVISNRRKYFAEPEILDPFIQWCLAHKVLPPPSSGDYRIVWHPVYELNELERAKRALDIAQGANFLTNGMGTEVISVDDFRTIIDMPTQEKTQAGQDEQAALETEEEELQTEVGFGSGRGG